jgi:4-carboxymuconolactone decarboxylase
VKSRLHLPRPDDMTPQQRAIFDEVLRTRGNASGPFLAWLTSPGLAGPAQQLGAFCRYNTSLSLAESELLILYVAAHYSCVGEQQIHEPIARKAGLSNDVLIAIRTDEVPPVTTHRLRLLGSLARDLLVTKRISENLYGQAVNELGEQALVEVVGVIGYYALVAYTLNAFEMKLE